LVKPYNNIRENQYKQNSEQIRSSKAKSLREQIIAQQALNAASPLKLFSGQKKTMIGNFTFYPSIKVNQFG